MRADRLLAILLLLQVHRRLTAGELARRLEVSERTIHRDMEALGAAGVPVWAQRGAGGGWRLDEGYRTEPGGLTEAEVRALFLGKPARLLAELGLGGAAEAGLAKLLAALPSGGRRGAEDARGRIHVDVAGWRGGRDEVPLLPALQAAVWGERKVRLRYGRDGEESTERTVDPLGLVAKGTVWYLIAARGGEPRTYRVARVRGVAATEEPLERPAGFDLAAWWEGSKARFVAALPRVPVTLRAEPAALPRLRGGGRWARVEREEGPDGDGRTTVLICFETEDDARETVLGLGPLVEVVEPAALRAEVVALAAGVLARYGRAGAGIGAGGPSAAVPPFGEER